ncbi:MAG TPA: hypothetical protein VFL83_22105 [Anaeromyxobacter sp.]|nr:hypothetical protein [Anaeromyxobacter sp.]
MRTYALARIVVLAAAAALPEGAAARGQARIGFTYSQVDYWLADVPHTRTPHLDLDLGLRLAGGIFSRDVVSYDLGAGYRSLRDSVNGVDVRRNQLITYNGHVAILQNPISPLTLMLGASRAESTFVTDFVNDLSGDAIVTTYAADLMARSAVLPPIQAGYVRTEVEDHVPGQVVHLSSKDNLRASLGFGNNAYAFEASYGGEFSDGTYVADRYTIHDASATVRMNLGSSQLSVESDASTNTPTDLVAGSYRVEAATFRANYNNGAQDGARREVGYGYGRALAETTVQPLEEQARQSLGYRGDHLLTSPTLFARWYADVSIAETRSGARESQATGETLGVQLWWRRLSDATRYEIRGGPFVGLIQNEDGDDTGYGARAGVRLTRPLWGYRLQFEWSADYAMNLLASAGWTFSQQLSGTLDGQMGDARVSGTLRASSFRTYQPLVGDGAGRTVEAFAGARYRRIDFDGRVRLQQGIAGATPGQFVGDGLLIPSPFNSRSVTLQLGARAKILPSLSASLHFGALSRDLPGSPALESTEVVAGLGYGFAAFALSVEDRVSWFERGTGWDRINVVFARVSRTFGW